MAVIDESEANEWLDRDSRTFSPEGNNSDGAKKERKRKSATESVELPTAQPARVASSTSKGQPEFSSSVSFWWGRRILKPDNEFILVS